MCKPLIEFHFVYFKSYFASLYAYRFRLDICIIYHINVFITIITLFLNSLNSTQKTTTIIVFKVIHENLFYHIIALSKRNNWHVTEIAKIIVKYIERCYGNLIINYLQKNFWISGLTICTLYLKKFMVYLICVSKCAKMSYCNILLIYNIKFMLHSKYNVRRSIECINLNL